MPTALELKLIHVARKQAGLEEEQYRMVLRNVAGVKSSKDLTQIDVENVMAVLEDSGFRYVGKPADYWRRIVAQRGSQCGPRILFKIQELAAQQSYDVAALCRRLTDERIADPAQLHPRDGMKLIEALKAIIKRQSAAALPSPVGAAGVAALARVADGIGGQSSPVPEAV